MDDSFNCLFTALAMTARRLALFGPRTASRPRRCGPSPHLQGSAHALPFGVKKTGAPREAANAIATMAAQYPVTVVEHPDGRLTRPAPDLSWLRERDRKKGLIESSPGKI